MLLGQLGRSDEARPLIEAALRRKPDVRERLWDMARIWNLREAQIEHIADGLRKAGLAIAPAPPASSSDAAPTSEPAVLEGHPARGRSH
jgi:hypothetical protein